MTQNLTNLSQDLKNAIRIAQEAFYNASREMVRAGIEVFQKLINLLMEGNPYNKLLSNLDDLTRGIEDLKQQINQIKSTFGRILETV